LRPWAKNWLTASKYLAESRCKRRDEKTKQRIRNGRGKAWAGPHILSYILHTNCGCAPPATEPLSSSPNRLLSGVCQSKNGTYTPQDTEIFGEMNADSRHGHLSSFTGWLAAWPNPDIKEPKPGPTKPKSSLPKKKKLHAARVPESNGRGPQMPQHTLMICGCAPRAAEPSSLCCVPAYIGCEIRQRIYIAENVFVERQGATRARNKLMMLAGAAFSP
jgi:hypothetical protein